MENEIMNYESTEEGKHEAKIGNCIARLLGLKKIRRGEQAGRYNTAWGTKTELGLYACVKRVIEEERINV